NKDPLLVKGMYSTPINTFNMFFFLHYCCFVIVVRAIIFHFIKILICTVCYLRASEWSERVSENVDHRIMHMMLMMSIKMNVTIKSLTPGLNLKLQYLGITIQKEHTIL
ncbi:hypothetical protein ACJX0J_015482, partial [Zea mays]